MPILRISSGSAGLKTKLILGMILVLMAAGLSLIAVLAIGMMLFVVPVLVLSAVIYALLPKRTAERQPRRANDPQVLEGRYRVIGDASDDRQD